MNIHVLIDSIVQQTTVLLAQLATAGGVRAPLAHVANQVFRELAAEIERQGVSRKVAADMFGISLRAYQRKMHRLRESTTERGQSLWGAVLDFVTAGGLVSRAQVMQRFERDEPEQLGSILKDLVDSGLLFQTGSDQGTLYRSASEAELGALGRLEEREGLDEMVWAFVYRSGPITRDELLSRGLEPENLDAALARLCEAGRVRVEQRLDEQRYVSEHLYIAPDARVGWEASVYDHFQAVVGTIGARLSPAVEIERFDERVGGSTYTFDLPPDHPLAEEVLSTLSQFRQRCSELRRRVAAYNQQHGLGNGHDKVVAYAGQYVIPQGDHAVPGESSE